MIAATPHDFMARASLALLRPLDAPLQRDGSKVPVTLPAPGVKPHAHAGRPFDPSSHAALHSDGAQ